MQLHTWHPSRLLHRVRPYCLVPRYRLVTAIPHLLKLHISLCTGLGSMVGMAPISLAILHHLKVSYDPPKKNCQSAHPRLNFRILESLGSPSPFHQCKLELRQRPKRSRRPKVCKMFWMVKFRVFSLSSKGKINLWTQSIHMIHIPHDCFIQAAVPNALHSPGLSYIYSPWQPTKAQLTGPATGSVG